MHERTEEKLILSGYDLKKFDKIRKDFKKEVSNQATELFQEKRSYTYVKAVIIGVISGVVSFFISGVIIFVSPGC